MELRIVKFGSDFCKPCGILDKNLEGKKYEKIDVMKDQEEAVRYGIRNIPATLFFLGGELKEKKVGVFTAQEFDEIVNRIMES